MTQMKDDSLVSCRWEHDTLVEIKGAQVNDEEGNLQLRDKKATQEYPDQAIFRGDFHEGMRQGEGIENEQNGDFFVGEWDNDKKSGGFAVMISSQDSVMIDIDEEVDRQGLEVQASDNEEESKCSIFYQCISAFLCHRFLITMSFSIERLLSARNWHRNYILLYFIKSFRGL